MTISEIKAVLQARCHTPGISLSQDVDSACGADLMSDVMAFVKEKAMLLTGLVTPATVRTAELLDIPLVVFVRGKIPSTELISQAQEAGVCLLSTDYSLFESSGRLYNAGLVPSGLDRTSSCETAAIQEVKAGS